MLPDKKETKLGVCDQKASPSAGKNTRVVLVPCCTMKCVPTAISRYFRGPRVSFVKTYEFLNQVTLNHATF